MNSKWVQVWGQAHSAFSFFYYPSCKKTYRLVVKTSLSGKSVRFELSNECEKNDVQIADSKQQIADRKQQIENSKQQIANSKQLTANR